MPKMDGFQVQQEIRKLKLPVETIFLTMHNEPDLLHKAMDLGGKGYILKESALLEIVAGIRSVAAGHPLCQPLHDRRAARSPGASAANWSAGSCAI